MPEYIHYDPGTSPIVIATPHDSINPGEEDTVLSRLPDFVKKNLVNNRLVIREMLTANDSGAKAIAGFPDNNNHHKLSTTFPRFALDVNRNDKTDVDGYSVEGHQTDNFKPHGIIWRSTVSRVQSASDIIDALERPYTEQEYQNLLEMAYKPWMARYRQAMDTALNQNGFAIGLEVHTFPANMPGLVREPGRYQGAYALGPKSHRGEVKNMGDLMQGKMPDLLMITNWDNEAGKPRSCHPTIAQIIREEFEQNSLYVTDGFGPFQGDIGSTVLHSDPNNGRHIVGLEVIDHNLTPGKVEDGCVDFRKAEVAKLTKVFRRIYSRLTALRADDLR